MGGGVCVEEFEPKEDEIQCVHWLLCRSPALLLQSLEGPDGQSLRADQRKNAKRLLGVLRRGQQSVFRKTWPRSVEGLRQAAARACSRLPLDLPAPGAAVPAWQALEASLEECSRTVEKFW